MSRIETKVVAISRAEVESIVVSVMTEKRHLIITDLNSSKYVRLTFARGFALLLHCDAQIVAIEEHFLSK